MGETADSHLTATELVQLMKRRVLPNRRGCTCVLWEATETTRWDLTAATALQHIHQLPSHVCMCK